MAEDKLQLFCLVFPDNHPNDVFLVEIDSNELVGVLRDIIKLELFPRFNCLNVTDLFLWKCSIPADDNLGPTMDSIKFDQGDSRQVTYLNPTRKISRYFGDDEEPEGTIRILVQVPGHDQHPPPPAPPPSDREEDKDMAELIEKLDKTVTKLLESDHRAAKSSGYITFQKHGEPIYDGRYPGPYVADQRIDTRAPPIQLYHAAFGHFLSGIYNRSLEVPTEVIQATARLMNLASAIYQNEAQRGATIQEELTRAISVAVGIELFDSVTTAPDGTVITEILVGNELKPAAICIKEDKNEIGDGGADPSIQAGLSYGQFWAQKNQAELRANSCCPTFLFVTAGPSFAILGAIWTDKVVVQRLTDFIWIGNDTIFNEPSIYRIARILHAFGLSTRSLAAYYQSLIIQPHPIRERFFPSINTYREADNSIVKFKFIRHLEPHSICITFLAVTEAPGSKIIVVKFVHRYNEEAHRLLADRDMAPKLLYCGEVGSIRASARAEHGHPKDHLHMIVMDYVDGLRADIAHWHKSLPQNFLEQVKAILAHLHDHDYVFGDLRGQNIMVTKNDRVLFIDFDWVGKDGESRYPIIMAESIDWPEGVKDGLGVMKKEHDMYMLKRLF